MPQHAAAPRDGTATPRDEPEEFPGYEAAMAGYREDYDNFIQQGRQPATTLLSLLDENVAFFRDLKQFDTPETLAALRENGALNVASSRLSALRGSLDHNDIPQEIRERYSKSIKATERQLQRLKENVSPWRRVLSTAAATVVPYGLSFASAAVENDRLYLMRITSNYARSTTKLLGQMMNPTSDTELFSKLFEDRLLSFVVPAAFALPPAVAGKISEPHSRAVTTLASLQTSVPYNTVAGLVDAGTLFGVSYAKAALNAFQDRRSIPGIPEARARDVAEKLLDVRKSIEDIRIIAKPKKNNDQLDSHITELQNASDKLDGLWKHLEGTTAANLRPPTGTAAEQSGSAYVAKAALLAGSVGIAVVNNYLASSSKLALTNYVPYSVWQTVKLAADLRNPNVSVQGMSNRFGSLASGTAVALIPTALARYLPDYLENNTKFGATTAALALGNLFLADMVGKGIQMGASALANRAVESLQRSTTRNTGAVASATPVSVDADSTNHLGEPPTSIPLASSISHAPVAAEMPSTSSLPSETAVRGNNAALHPEGVPSSVPAGPPSMPEHTVPVQSPSSSAAAPSAAGPEGGSRSFWREVADGAPSAVLAPKESRESLQEVKSAEKGGSSYWGEARNSNPSAALPSRDSTDSLQTKRSAKSSRKVLATG